MASGLQRRRPVRWAALLFVVTLGSGLALLMGGDDRAPRPVGVTVAADVRTDASDARGSPLEMFNASLVHRDVRMILRVTTPGTWRASDLIAQTGRGVCLMLARGVPAAAHGRICVTALRGHSALTYTPLAADGTAGVTRKVGATVKRPRRSVLEATFLPVAAGMRPGPYSWWLQTDWTDASACASKCTDRLPDAGAISARLGLVGVVPCFGAAARDPARPCRNPDLRLAVEPPPERAGVTLDPFCNTRIKQPISVCAFGALPETAARTFAIIGDSHVAALKTALEVVTLAKRWRGMSMIVPSCPATKAKPILSTRSRSRACANWNAAVLRWLAANPGTDTVFLSTHTTADVKRKPGQKMFDAARAGYRGEIAALLRVASRVVVIRDTPYDAPGHLSCIRRAVAAGRAPGPACARPRSRALDPDPLARAARDMRSPRVRVIDLTRLVCNRRRCFPVIGGALVHRDETHVTPAFSATLGPFILRELDR